MGGSGYTAVGRLEVKNVLTWLSSCWNGPGSALIYTTLGFLKRGILRWKSELLSKFAVGCAASQNLCINIHPPNVCLK